MNETVYEFLNPSCVELDEDGDWAVRRDDYDTMWLSSQMYDVKVVLTKKFNPKDGDYVKLQYGDAGTYRVMGRDGENLWLRSGASYLTKRVSEVRNA